MGYSRVMDSRRVFGSVKGGRFFLIRLGFVALCLLSALIFPALLERSQREQPRKRTLVFSLPLPEDYAARNGIDRNPDIESVHVSGLFARWKSDNPAFLMDASPMGDSWSLSLPFPRGVTQYKFVLRIRGRQGSFWIHDTDNPHAVADGFGGLNSTVAIETGLPPAALRLALLAVAAAIALYDLLSLALRLLARLRLTATQRALLIFCLVLLVAGLVSGLYGTEAQRRAARQAYLEISDMACLAMEAKGFDFLELEGSSATLAANAAFDSFFRNARLRTAAGGPTGPYSSVHRFVLFDREGNAIAVGDRNESPFPVANRSDRYLLRSTFSEGSFRELLAKMRESGEDPLEGVYGYLPGKEWGDYAGFQRASRLLGFNAALFPVRRDLMTTAYLGLIISPQAQGGRIAEGLLFHALWVACLLVCCVFLFLFKQTASELNPSLVSEFVKRHGLSPRETELLGALVAGQDYQGIADKNFISLKTVKTHVHNIYKKTSVSNRLELVEAIRQRK